MIDKIPLERFSRGLFTVVLLLGLASCHRRGHQQLDCTGPWIPKHISWQNEHHNGRESKLSYQTPVFYFSPDGEFRELHWLVFEGSSVPESLCLGPEGGLDYAGKWEYANNGLHVQYRLMDRAVRIVGETLPGPILDEWIRFAPDSGGAQRLLFKEDTLVRSDRFCPSSMRSILIIHRPQKQ
ncbi:MAG TPA: hypothetical protein VMS71_08155 [Candidatus Acidoferrum sp.]|nr:hypothetical protein [Candidatus Acidoferrum sp.]